MISNPYLIYILTVHFVLPCIVFYYIVYLLYRFLLQFIDYSLLICYNLLCVAVLLVQMFIFFFLSFSLHLCLVLIIFLSKSYQLKIN